MNAGQESRFVHVANRCGRKPAWCLAAFGLLLLALAGCGQSSRQASSELPVYFTCDVDGRLEPCGCFSGQFGGLTRLKTVLDAEAPANALRLDVGDSIAGHEDYDLIQYRYVLRAFAGLKYDAVNIGGREAQLSAVQLDELKRTSPVPILSANLVNLATKKPVFDSYRIVKRDGFRIAIIGVLDPRSLKDDVGPGLAVGDMESAVTRCLEEVRTKADIFILLAFADEAALARLAQQFYEFHVILGGKVSQPAQELRKENRSLIYFVTNEARALGILRLRLIAGAPPKPVANEIRLLHDKIPQDKSFDDMVQTYRTEIRHTQLAVDDPSNAGADAVPGVRTAGAYVGSRRCIECHITAGAVWTKSAHARAFTTLTMHNADADPKCIGCHTIGFGAVSGYRRKFGAGKLVDVGCESCHGPGSLHVRQREGDSTISFAYRPLGAGDCQKCHYGEFSRPFDWDAFWPRIKHGNEPGQMAAGNAG